MQNEIRYYLTSLKALMETDEPFVPCYFVVAVKIPSGAIELIVNTSDIANKMEYILDAYDDDMRLKTNPDVQVQNMLIV